MYMYVYAPDLQCLAVLDSVMYIVNIIMCTILAKRNSVIQE